MISVAHFLCSTRLPNGRDLALARHGWFNVRPNATRTMLDLECPLVEQLDKPSIRLAGACEGSHDLVDAGFKLGDRERFLKKRKWCRVLTHDGVAVTSGAAFQYFVARVHIGEETSFTFK